MFSFSTDYEVIAYLVMESGVGDASPTTPGTPMETAHTKGVQNGDAAAAIEPEPSKNENESIGE